MIDDFALHKEAPDLKIAVTGKGGVGKTTICALLAMTLRHGNRVTVIDADPDANLALTLGHPDPSSIVPLTRRKDLIEERVGSGGMIRLNPRVDDLAETVGVDVDGIRLIVLGTIAEGGGGCFCAPSALLKAFLAHVLAQPEDWVILDMQAGLEHLGRGSSAGVDGLVVVVEPSRRSIETAAKIRRLAGDLGIRRLWGVANKVASAEEARSIERELEAIPLVASIPLSARLGAFSARLDIDSIEPGIIEKVESIRRVIAAS